MSSLNCGGRKNRSIRDNLFIVYAVINDALGFMKVDLDIQFYDLKQAFDSMWFDETMNDLWETMKPRDDKFALIAERSENVISLSRLHVSKNQNKKCCRTVVGT